MISTKLALCCPINNFYRSTFTAVDEFLIKVVRDVYYHSVDESGLSSIFSLVGLLIFLNLAILALRQQEYS